MYMIIIIVVVIISVMSASKLPASYYVFTDSITGNLPKLPVTYHKLPFY